MEWGIKLKNNLISHAFSKLIIKVLLLSILLPLFYLLMLFTITQLDFNWLYRFSPNLYFALLKIFKFIFLSSFSFLFFLLIWGLLILYLVFKMLKKIDFYITCTVLQIDHLFNKEKTSIELPKELADLENKLNYLKMRNEKNERLAKESIEKKDELIIYLAHDIKTPLTSMIGYLSLLEEIEDMPKRKQRKYIKIALEKSYKLEELVNELFETARFNSEKIILEKEDVNLSLMLEQIIDDFYPTLKELNKEIHLEGKKNLSIFVDPLKMARVFNNLIKNAINYSNKTKDIWIEVKEENKQVTIKIINQGSEIPQEKLDRIFEKFYRLDASRNSKTGGSGLGLAIAKEIVLLHGGTIEAKSKKQETIFEVTLPLN